MPRRPHQGFVPHDECTMQTPGLLRKLCARGGDPSSRAYRGKSTNIRCELLSKDRDVLVDGHPQCLTQINKSPLVRVKDPLASPQDRMIQRSIEPGFRSRKVSFVQDPQTPELRIDRFIEFVP